MKLIRIRDPKWVDRMADKLLEDDSFTRAGLAEFLKACLVHGPDNTFVVQAWDNRKLKGFGIALAQDGRTHCFILQVWVEPGVESVAQQFLEAAIAWTKQMGRIELRGETKRDVAAMYRAAGFKPYTTIVSLDLAESTESPAKTESDSPVKTQSTVLKLICNQPS